MLSAEIPRIRCCGRHVITLTTCWLFCLALSSGQNALERRLDRHVAH